MKRSLVAAIGLSATLAVFGWPAVSAQKGKPGSGFATFTTLPSFGNGSEAYAVDPAGTAVVGFARDRQDLIYPVKWTLEGEAWTMTSLPLPPGMKCAMAKGVNRYGDVAGNQEPARAPYAVFWPAGGAATLLGCDPDPVELWDVNGLSADAQIAVGVVAYIEVVNGERLLKRLAGSLWAPGACREELPGLVPGGGSNATAVNGDGTVVGGNAGGRPARWRKVAGQWLVESLHTGGGFVKGSNAGGDLAGYVSFPCGSATNCTLAQIWYLGGGSLQLGTLGGDRSWANGINADGEVVGGAATRQNVNTAFFWSQSRGMLELPFTGQWAIANAVSDVRPDGTRLVAGTNANSDAMVWVVRNQ